MSASRARNRAYAAGLFVVVGAFAAVPFAISQRRGAQGVAPLTRQEKPLVGHQLMRGAYNNYGSVDVGADPDWDHAAHAWKGDARREREGTSFAPSAEDLRLHRAALDAQLRARGLKKEAPAAGGGA
jgi:hypothetical protein